MSSYAPTGTDPRTVSGLQRELDGRAIHRLDLGYPTAAASRFVNPEISWDPEVVVACASADDVARAVDFAAEHGLGVAVRGGGVGWVGARPGTVLLDLRMLNTITVDPDRLTVRVGAGALWADIHRELAPFGLAAAGPQFPRLSAAGYALGGGHGWLSRKLGWGSDTVRSVELVSASGERVEASDQGEVELFWGLRGAGHNLGVAVSMEFSVIPLTQVYAGVIWFHPDRTAELLDFYRGWAPVLPDEVSTILGVMAPPSDLPVPAELRGRPMGHVVLCHCGSDSQAESDLKSLREHPGVVLDAIEAMPYAELAAGNNMFASGPRRRSRMRYLSGLAEPVVELTAERFADPPPLTMLSIHHYGGALGRVDENATAMSHRRQEWNYMVAMTWPSDETGSAHKRWQDDLLAGLAPDAEAAMYVNYLCQEPDRVSSAYNARTWERLRALKRQWDPQNRLADNHNIPPADDHARA
jgi:FAD/FMN-containing dehydrogenase